ncbi:MAG TPA: serine hydroxymethyltransferase, partial [Thermoanaerobaculia bacterium]|nr:serine hydroxymethyltransferase [Thermoanaerobaculia bacterium]
DNHVFLVDVAVAGLTGKVAENALEAAGITVNKNTIPFDTNSPMVASGIRIGTPALTTRGMKEPEMDEVGDLISEVLKSAEDPAVGAAVRAKVRALCAHFPLYDPLM